RRLRDLSARRQGSPPRSQPVCAADAQAPRCERPLRLSDSVRDSVHPPCRGAREGCGDRLPDPLDWGGARLTVAARRPGLALLRGLAAGDPCVRRARGRLNRSLPPAAVRARVAFPEPHGRGRPACASRGREALSLVLACVAARHASLLLL